jgi:ribonuclease Z
MVNVEITFLGTGAGNCIYRNHTAIVVDCPDGTRLLLDASSGNSVLRQGAALGILAADFDQVLLTHQHPDHMGGLPHIRGQRSLVDPQGPPLRVYSAEESLAALRSLCTATEMRALSIDNEGARSRNGYQVFQWRPKEPGQEIELGPSTFAWSFAVDHIPGSVGWRIEASGLAVVFSGDTRYSDNLVEAARGARVLIHEAMTTGDKSGEARQRGHSTSTDAARAAALAGVEELIITHIDSPFHFNPQPLVDDARQHFGGPVSVAHDLYRVTVGSS